MTMAMKIGKKWCAVVLCAALLVSVTGCSEAKTQETVAGEEYIYAQITAINGNEITYAIAELVDMSAGNETQVSGESGAAEETGAADQFGESGQSGESQPSGWGGNFPGGNGEGDSGSFPGGRFPEGDGEGGNSSFTGGNGEGMPDMENMEGFTMPDMENMEDMTMPDFNNMEGISRPDRGDDGKQQGSEDSSNQTMYSLTGETVTTMIPVGTVVTTQLGTETTFSRLAVGDMLKIKLTTNDAGEQVILAIWIVG